MENIEYLEEYEDLVLPSIESDNKNRFNNGGMLSNNHNNTTDTDSSDVETSSSSAINLDIFEKLFPNNSDDDDGAEHKKMRKKLNVRAGVKSFSSSEYDSDDSVYKLISSNAIKTIQRKNRVRDTIDSIDALVQDYGEYIGEPHIKSKLTKKGGAQQLTKSVKSNKQITSTSKKLKRKKTSLSAIRGRPPINTKRSLAATKKEDDAASGSNTTKTVPKLKNPQEQQQQKVQLKQQQQQKQQKQERKIKVVGTLSETKERPNVSATSKPATKLFSGSENDSDEFHTSDDSFQSSDDLTPTSEEEEQNVIDLSTDSNLSKENLELHSTPSPNISDSDDASTANFSEHLKKFLEDTRTYDKFIGEPEDMCDTLTTTTSSPLASSASTLVTSIANSKEHTENNLNIERECTKETACNNVDINIKLLNSDMKTQEEEVTLKNCAVKEAENLTLKEQMQLPVAVKSKIINKEENPSSKTQADFNSGSSEQISIITTALKSDPTAISTPNKSIAQGTPDINAPNIAKKENTKHFKRRLYDDADNNDGSVVKNVMDMVNFESSITLEQIEQSSLELQKQIMSMDYELQHLEQQQSSSTNNSPQAETKSDQIDEKDLIQKRTGARSLKSNIKTSPVKVNQRGHIPLQSRHCMEDENVEQIKISPQKSITPSEYSHLENAQMEETIKVDKGNDNVEKSCNNNESTKSEIQMSESEETEKMGPNKNTEVNGMEKVAINDEKIVLEKCLKVTTDCNERTVVKTIEEQKESKNTTENIVISNGNQVLSSDMNELPKEKQNTEENIAVENDEKIDLQDGKMPEEEENKESTREDKFNKYVEMEVSEIKKGINKTDKTKETAKHDTTKICSEKRLRKHEMSTERSCEIKKTTEKMEKSSKTKKLKTKKDETCKELQNLAEKIENVKITGEQNNKVGNENNESQKCDVKSIGKSNVASAVTKLEESNKQNIAEMNNATKESKDKVNSIKRSEENKNYKQHRKNNETEKIKDVNKKEKIQVINEAKFLDKVKEKIEIADKRKPTTDTPKGIDKQSESEYCQILTINADKVKGTKEDIKEKSKSITASVVKTIENIGNSKSLVDVVLSKAAGNETNVKVKATTKKTEEERELNKITNKNAVNVIKKDENQKLEKTKEHVFERPRNKTPDNDVECSNMVTLTPNKRSDSFEQIKTHYMRSPKSEGNSPSKQCKTSVEYKKHERRSSSSESRSSELSRSNSAKSIKSDTKGTKNKNLDDSFKSFRSKYDKQSDNESDTSNQTDKSLDRKHGKNDSDKTGKSKTLPEDTTSKIENIVNTNQISNSKEQQNKNKIKTKTVEENSKSNTKIATIAEKTEFAQSKINEDKAEHKEVSTKRKTDKQSKEKTESSTINKTDTKKNDNRIQKRAQEKINQNNYKTTADAIKKVTSVSGSTEDENNTSITNDKEVKKTKLPKQNVPNITGMETKKTTKTTNTKNEESGKTITATKTVALNKTEYIMKNEEKKQMISTSVENYKTTETTSANKTETPTKTKDKINVSEKVASKIDNSTESKTKVTTGTSAATTKPKNKPVATISNNSPVNNKLTANKKSIKSKQNVAEKITSNIKNSQESTKTIVTTIKDSENITKIKDKEVAALKSARNSLRIVTLTQSEKDISELNADKITSTKKLTTKSSINKTEKALEKMDISKTENLNNDSSIETSKAVAGTLASKAENTTKFIKTQEKKELTKPKCGTPNCEIGSSVSKEEKNDIPELVNLNTKSDSESVKATTRTSTKKIENSDKFAEKKDTTGKTVSNINNTDITKPTIRSASKIEISVSSQEEKDNSNNGSTEHAKVITKTLNTKTESSKKCQEENGNTEASLSNSGSGVLNTRSKTRISIGKIYTSTKLNDKKDTIVSINNSSTDNAKPITRTSAIKAELSVKHLKKSDVSANTVHTSEVEHKPTTKTSINKTESTTVIQKKMDILEKNTVDSKDDIKITDTEIEKNTSCINKVITKSAAANSERTKMARGKDDISQDTNTLKGGGNVDNSKLATEKSISKSENDVKNLKKIEATKTKVSDTNKASEGTLEAATEKNTLVICGNDISTSPANEITSRATNATEAHESANTARVKEMPKNTLNIDSERPITRTSAAKALQNVSEETVGNVKSAKIEGSNNNKPKTRTDTRSESKSPSLSVVSASQTPKIISEISRNSPSMYLRSAQKNRLTLVKLCNREDSPIECRQKLKRSVSKYLSDHNQSSDEDMIIERKRRYIMGNESRKKVTRVSTRCTDKICNDIEAMNEKSVTECTSSSEKEELTVSDCVNAETIKIAADSVESNVCPLETCEKTGDDNSRTACVNDMENDKLIAKIDKKELSMMIAGSQQIEAEKNIAELGAVSCQRKSVNTKKEKETQELTNESTEVKEVAKEILHTNDITENINKNNNNGNSTSNICYSDIQINQTITEINPFDEVKNNTNISTVETSEENKEELKRIFEAQVLATSTETDVVMQNINTTSNPLLTEDRSNSKEDVERMLINLVGADETNDQINVTVSTEASEIPIVTGSNVELSKNDNNMDNLTNMLIAELLSDIQPTQAFTASNNANSHNIELSSVNTAETDSLSKMQHCDVDKIDIKNDSKPNEKMSILPGITNEYFENKTDGAVADSNGEEGKILDFTQINNTTDFDNLRNEQSKTSSMTYTNKIATLDTNDKDASIADAISKHVPRKSRRVCVRIRKINKVCAVKSTSTESELEVLTVNTGINTESDTTRITTPTKNLGSKSEVIMNVYSGLKFDSNAVVAKSDNSNSEDSDTLLMALGRRSLRKRAYDMRQLSPNVGGAKRNLLTTNLNTVSERPINQKQEELCTVNKPARRRKEYERLLDPVPVQKRAKFIKDAIYETKSKINLRSSTPNAIVRSYVATKRRSKAKIDANKDCAMSTDYLESLKTNVIEENQTSKIKPLEAINIVSDITKTSAEGKITNEENATAVEHTTKNKDIGSKSAGTPIKKVNVDSINKMTLKETTTTILNQSESAVKTSIASNNSSKEFINTKVQKLNKQQKSIDEQSNENNNTLKSAISATTNATNSAQDKSAEPLSNSSIIKLPKISVANRIKSKKKSSFKNLTLNVSAAVEPKTPDTETSVESTNNVVNIASSTSHNKSHERTTSNDLHQQQVTTTTTSKISGLDKSNEQSPGRVISHTHKSFTKLNLSNLSHDKSRNQTTKCCDVDNNSKPAAGISSSISDKSSETASTSSKSSASMKSVIANLTRDKLSKQTTDNINNSKSSVAERSPATNCSTRDKSDELSAATDLTPDKSSPNSSTSTVNTKLIATSTDCDTKSDQTNTSTAAALPITSTTSSLVRNLSSEQLISKSSNATFVKQNSKFMQHNKPKQSTIASKSSPIVSDKQSSMRLDTSVGKPKACDKSVERSQSTRNRNVEMSTKDPIAAKPSNIVTSNVMNKPQKPIPIKLDASIPKPKSTSTPIDTSNYIKQQPQLKSNAHDPKTLIEIKTGMAVKHGAPAHPVAISAAHDLAKNNALLLGDTEKISNIRKSLRYRVLPNKFIDKFETSPSPLSQTSNKNNEPSTVNRFKITHPIADLSKKTLKRAPSAWAINDSPIQAKRVRLDVAGDNTSQTEKLKPLINRLPLQSNITSTHRERKSTIPDLSVNGHKKKLRVLINRRPFNNYIKKLEQAKKQKATIAVKNMSETITTTKQLSTLTTAANTKSVTYTLIEPKSEIDDNIPSKAAPVPVSLIQTKFVRPTVKPVNAAVQLKRLQSNRSNGLNQVCSTAIAATICNKITPTSTTTVPSTSSARSISQQSKNTDSKKNRNGVIVGDTSSYNTNINADTYSIGHTRMYSYLCPVKFHRSAGQVLLDYCCPNLDGPMLAIDPTKLHDEVNVPVLELPAYIVMTTHVVSVNEYKKDQNILPEAVRMKILRKNGGFSIHSYLAAGGGIISNQSVPITTATTSSVSATNAVTVSSSLNFDKFAPTATTIDYIRKQLPPSTTITQKTRCGSTPMQQMTTAVSTASTTATVNAAATTSAAARKQQNIEKQMACAKVKPFSNDTHLNLMHNIKYYDELMHNACKLLTSLSMEERHQAIKTIINDETLTIGDLVITIKVLENYIKMLQGILTKPATERLSDAIATVVVNSSSCNEASRSITAIANTMLDVTQTLPTASSVPVIATKISAANVPLMNTTTIEITKSNKPLNKYMRNPSNTCSQTRNERHAVPIYGLDKQIIGYQIKQTAAAVVSASAANPKSTNDWDHVLKSAHSATVTTEGTNADAKKQQNSYTATTSSVSNTTKKITAGNKSVQQISQLLQSSTNMAAEPMYAIRNVHAMADSGSDAVPMPHMLLPQVASSISSNSSASASATSTSNVQKPTILKNLLSRPQQPFTTKQIAPTASSNNQMNQTNLSSNIYGMSDIDPNSDTETNVFILHKKNITNISASNSVEECILPDEVVTTPLQIKKENIDEDVII